MKPESKDWLDIPDPLAEAPTPAARAPAVPAVPSPTRAEMKRRRMGALVVSIVWASAVLAFFGLREELAENSGLVAGQAILWFVLFCAAIALAVGKGRRGLGSG